MSCTPITAEQEYIKNPELKKEDIEELRQWILSQPHLPVPTEEQLILFHHSCYYDMKATKSCIEIYYNIRSSTPEFFSNRDLSREELKQAVEVLHYGCLPVKDSKGYQIISHGLLNYEASKYVFSDGVKLLMMAVDACIHVEGTVPGYIFLFDMKGVKLSHLTRLSVGFLKKFFTYIQVVWNRNGEFRGVTSFYGNLGSPQPYKQYYIDEGMPLRLKAIHVVNTLPVIDKIMFIIKPFMKKELIQLIHFHSSNMEDVQKFLPKNCLLRDHAGDLPSINELHEKYIDWMSKLKPYFDEEEQYRIKEKSKKSKKDKENDDMDFKTLSID